MGLTKKNQKLRSVGTRGSVGSERKLHMKAGGVYAGKKADVAG